MQTREIRCNPVRRWKHHLFCGILSALCSFSTQAFNLFWVTNAADAGPGTLRQAILDANAVLPGDNSYIFFDIPPSGPHAIYPLSPLPAITRQVLIFADTQPGFTTKPIIHLSGVSAGPANGFRVLTAGCRISGFAINQFSSDGTDATGNGILLVGGGGNRIYGNHITANQCHGISIWQSSDNIIGSANIGDRNVISGNQTNGINIAYPDGSAIFANSNIIQGNYIGVDPTGLGGMGNGANGVRVYRADHTRIGGDTPGEGNAISGNLANGILLEGPSGFGSDFVRHTIIQGNLIGTDSTGAAAVGNGAQGISLIKAQTNLIGGSLSAAGNVISGNGQHGIRVGGAYFGVGDSGNVIAGNRIGLAASGTALLGNTVDGINLWLLPESNNLIGSTNTTGTGNVIAGNGRNGIGVAQGDGCRISRNSIYANTELGIDLGESTFGGGLSFNDVGDPDTGPNAYQNFPVLTNIFSDGYSTIISGGVNSEPSKQYQLQFFWSSSCDWNNHGEGEIFVGETMVTTDAAGNVEFRATYPIGVSRSGVMTATATSFPEFNTSEFSSCTGVRAPPLLAISRSGSLVRISWSALFGDWILQRSPGSTPYSWSDYPTPPSRVGDDWVATDSLSPSGYHYRLRSP